MGSAKHEKSFVDFEKPYEQNVVGLKGIIYFGIGLLVLIVITFGLMWAFVGVLEEDAKARKSSTNPLSMSDRESLPPEPRLQGAPGFGVEGPNGRVNLELREPQAEYRELKKQWDALLHDGSKDQRTGAVLAMPVDRAKEMLLQKALKARSGPEADKAAEMSRRYASDASSGRMASVTRR